MNAPAEQSILAETADAFYARIFRSLIAIMAGLALVLTPAIWLRFHRNMGLSFAAGSLIAILNFHWLALTIRAAGAKAESTGGRKGRVGLVLRFMLRYFLIALAAYAIFKGSAESLYGLFAGLSLPVGAILTETVIELYRVLRAGI